MNLTEQTFGFIYPQYMAFLRGSLNPAMVVLATKNADVKPTTLCGYFAGISFTKNSPKMADYPTYGHVIGMVSNHSMSGE